MPHSNFDSELRIASESGRLLVRGPLDSESDEYGVARVVVTATVTQQPKGKTKAMRATPQQGATCFGRATYKGAIPDVWEFEGRVSGGELGPGWAFATAEQTVVADSGAIERYTWSQWVWLHHT